MRLPYLSGVHTKVDASACRCTLSTRGTNLSLDNDQNKCQQLATVIEGKHGQEMLLPKQDASALFCMTWCNSPTAVHSDMKTLIQISRFSFPLSFTQQGLFYLWRKSWQGLLFMIVTFSMLLWYLMTSNP